MKKETFVFSLLVIIAVTSYFGYNFFVQQKDFQQKQQCHDEAIKYVDNLQKTYDSQVKLDNGKSSYAYIYNAYNKDLNTCVVYYGNTDVPDNVKFHNLGIFYWEKVDDVLTGRGLDWWTTNYKPDSYDVSFASGQIRGKDITNRQDFDDELALLFGNEYKNYLASPTPTSAQASPTSGYLPVLDTPTPTTAQPVTSSRQTFFNSCTYGSIYCTCLYDVLHRIDPGNEAADYIAENGSGNNAPMINAYAECNSKFGSK